MNNSTVANANYDDIYRSGRAFDEILAEIIVRSSVSVFGAAINLLVFVTFWFTPSLINSSVLLLWNLSAADLMMCLVAIPVSLRTSFLYLRGHCRPFGSIPWNKASVNAAFAASIVTLVLMSLDRCFMISFPIKYRQFITVKKVKFLLTVIWAYALVSSVFLLTETFSKKMESLWIFSGLIICYLTISVSYYFVFKGIRKQRKIQPENQPTMRQQIAENQLARTIVIIIVIFTVSWVPMGYSLFMYPAGSHHWLPHWAATVGMVTALTNPIIYFSRKKTYRNAARALVC